MCVTMLHHCTVTLHLTFFTIFFFNDPATTDIYTLSLHDALPISYLQSGVGLLLIIFGVYGLLHPKLKPVPGNTRSEEHTSELQSRFDLVCRLLLEKKNKKHAAMYCIISDINLAATTTNNRPLHKL